MKTYKVSEVSKIMGISSHTLRYWDRIGLLNFVGRDEHGNRAFKRTDFLALRTITCMKSTGMHLNA
ncbi:MerR family transcriptional regulator [Ligilactobacillus sp. LYQ135]